MRVRPWLPARFAVRLCAAASLLALACAPSADAPPNYDAIFERSRVAVWQLTLDDAQWQRLQTEPQTYVPARLTAAGQTFDLVGLRLMGTKVRSKRNLRIRFNSFSDQQRFYGLKRVNLRSGWDDPSMIREALALSLMRRAGVPAPRWAFVWLELNGRGGLYTLVEQVDRKFLADRFGDRDGNLYKLEQGADLSYYGEAIDDYPAGLYELKTDEAVDPWRDLIGLTRTLAFAQDEQVEGALSRQLDIDAFLRALALNSWLVNMNAYPGSADNAYLYRATDGRFRYIPWDPIQAFGDFHGSACGLVTDELVALDLGRPTCGATRPLVDRVLGLSSSQTRYRRELLQLSQGVLDPARVLAQADALHALVDTRAREDELKNTSYSAFEDSLDFDLPNERHPHRTPGLRRFVHARHAAAQRYLQQHEE